MKPSDQFDFKVMSGVTKKTSKVTKTNENEGAGPAANAVTKLKRNRKYLTKTNKTHLALTTFFVTTTFLLHHATAEKYIGMNHYLSCSSHQFTNLLLPIQVFFLPKFGVMIILMML